MADLMRNANAELAASKQGQAEGGKPGDGGGFVGWDEMKKMMGEVEEGKLRKEDVEKMFGMDGMGGGHDEL